MDFPDALRALNDGHRVTRADWATCGRCALYVERHVPGPDDPGANVTHLLQTFADGTRQPYQPSQRDMDATNWHTTQEPTQ